MKYNREDLQRWKDNEFTKFFFEVLESDIEKAEKSLVNICTNTDDRHVTSLVAGQILALKKIPDIDCARMGIEEEESKNE
jgi:hypothetical protein